MARQPLLQDTSESHRVMSRQPVLCHVLLVLCLCTKCLVGTTNTHVYDFGEGGSRKVKYKRQESSPQHEDSTVSNNSSDPGKEVAQFFQNYWFIFIVAVILVVIAIVFVCACVVKVKKRSHRQSQIFRLNSNNRKTPKSNPSLKLQNSVDEHSLPHHTGSSMADLASRSPLSLSMGSTPIPSPQPSYSSYQSCGHGKQRRKHSSGQASSSSEETIRAHDSHSTSSLVSYSSSAGYGSGAIHPRVSHAESTISAGDQMPSYVHSNRHNGNGKYRHKRTTSNPHTKQLLSFSYPDTHSLCSIPCAASVHSMESSHTVRSGLSSRSHSNSQKTLVDVDVTVHMGLEQDYETRKEIAAALAESARKLAQSAANFGQEEEDSFRNHPHRQLSPRGYSQSAIHSKRQLFTSQSPSILLGHEGGTNISVSPSGLPCGSLDRPTNFDRPHHTFPIRSELSRCNSMSRAPPPESPLRISHSRYSSERSLSLEGAPSNYPRLPIHIQTHHVHSAMSLNQREVSLDNLHKSPSPPSVPPLHDHAFPTRTKSKHSPSPSTQVPPSLTGSLDFHGQEEQISPQVMLPDATYLVKGTHSPRLYSYLRTDGIHSVLEPDHGVSPDSGMGNGDYGTGTESSSSTLKSLSHRDKKDRLSRLSEKSEYLEGELDEMVEDQAEGCREMHPTKMDNFRLHPSAPPNRLYHSSSNRDDSVYSQESNTKQTSSNLGPKLVEPTSPRQYAGHNSQSSGSVVSLDENSTASGYAATGSCVSSTENLSKVYPNGSESHDTHMTHNILESQFSYPLERLLSQPMSYDIDSSDIDIPVGDTFVSSSRISDHKHSHCGTSHGNSQVQRSRLKTGDVDHLQTYSRSGNGPLQYPTGNGPLQYPTQALGGHAQNCSFTHLHDRPRSASKTVPDSFRSQQLTVPFSSIPHHNIQANGYQSGSITVDV